MNEDPTTGLEVITATGTATGLRRRMKATRTVSTIVEDEICAEALADGRIRFKSTISRSDAEPKSRTNVHTLTPHEALALAERLRSLAILGLAGVPKE